MISRRFSLSRLSARSHATAALTAVAFALAGAGCSHPIHDELAEAVANGEHPVAMLGKSDFFDGQLTATVTVSRGVGQGTHNGGGSSRKHDSGGDNGGLSGGDTMSDDQAYAYMRARGAIGSPLPPVSLHLKLENKSKSVYQVEIQEFDSDLGNFAVEPSLLSLAPGQVAEPDPMISQLGVTSDDIPVKVTLRLGDKIESQTIPVKNLAAPPSEANAPVN
jgi:hypothetical protein